MTLWTRCKVWMNQIFFRQEVLLVETAIGELETTCVVDCRSALVERTQVVECEPRFAVKRSTAGTTDWAPKRHDEKRVALRYPCDRAVVCRRADIANEVLQGRARNLSVNGVGLILPQRIAPGTLLIVAIGSSRGPIVHEIQARVVHSRPMPVRGWFLGCEFGEQLEMDDVKALT